MVSGGKNELYYEAGKDAVNFQNALHRELSDRAMNLLNFGVATSAAAVVVLNFRLDDLSFEPGMVAALTLWGLGFVALLVSCFLVLQIQDWEPFFSLENLSSEVRKYATSRDALLWDLAETLKEAVQHNQEVLDGKATAMNWAMTALGVKIAAVTSVLIQIFVAGSESSPAAPSAFLLG